MKRFLAYMLMIGLLFTQSLAVCAEEMDSAKTSDSEKTAEELAAEAEAKERTASYAASPETNALDNWPQGPSVYADSAIVMDMDSGAILYEKNGDKQHFPASITKLLTVLVALENAELSDTVYFTEDSVSFLEWDDAQIGMKPGEERTLEDSLYAILLASANEVSHAVAESVGEQRLGGDYDTFIRKMNTRAKELGCTGSNWVNPNGLHDDAHYTTAHDMALIASAVYQHEEFHKIMETLEYKIGSTNLTQEERVFQQNHKMLWPENYYYYEYCTGGKTGYTDQSKTTLVTMADNGKMRLAAVLLYDYGVDAYNDTRAMFDYVFDNFSKISVVEAERKDSEDIRAFDDSAAYVVLPEGVEPSMLERKLTLTENGLRSGKICYTYEGQEVGSAGVTLTEAGYKKAVAAAESDGENGDGKTDENGGGADSQNGKDQTDNSRDAGNADIRENGTNKSGNGKFYVAVGVVGAALIGFMVVRLQIRAQGRRKKRRRR